MIERREDLDSRTTGQDYSRSVLAFAASYRELNDAVEQLVSVAKLGLEVS